MSAQLNLQERREHIRYAVTGRLPGKLMDHDGNPVTLFPLDVSKYGLGLLTSKPLKAQSVVSFVLNEEGISPIPLKVVWSFEDTSQQYGGSIFRCGFRLEKENTDLVALFESFENIILENTN